MKSTKIVKTKPKRLRTAPYVPWAGQRLASRSNADTRVVVCARQVGKTVWAAFETLRVACKRAGSTSVVMAPVEKPYLRNAIDRVLLFARTLQGAVWKERLGRLELSNGSVVQFLSAGGMKGEKARGPTVDGVLWIDEAALLPRHAYEAALGMLITGNGRLLLTTTPVGRNWVYDEFTSKDPKTARFRFKAHDSPYTNKERIREIRQKLSPEKAAQDYDAVFVDDLLQPFPDTSRLFVKTFPDRSRESKGSLKNVIGIDLAKEVDWTVATLMNRWGEAEILDRWQKRDWLHTYRDLADLAKAHEAVVVLDVGAGGGMGGPCRDALLAYGIAVTSVRTADNRIKETIVNLTRDDVRFERIRVLENRFADQLRYELKRLQGLRRIDSKAKVITVYEALSLEGEHDDCVISLCLANWGRLHVTGVLDVADEREPTAEELVRSNERLGRILRAADPGLDLGDGTHVRPSQGLGPFPFGLGGGTAGHGFFF